MRYFRKIEYLLDMLVLTIYWEKHICRIIDQTLLPVELKEIEITSPEQMFEAIKLLRVRGAPAIGIAGAIGVYLGIKNVSSSGEELRNKAESTASYLASCRPTAVNLFWGVDRIKELVFANAEKPIEEIKAMAYRETQRMIDEDNEICRKIGEHGSGLLENGSTVLTHCNAGGLATARFGTALAPVYIAKEQGKKIKVYADETRPLLQGARLTTWELMQNGIDVVLICDNMAASVMAKGWIDIVIVGTDRVAENGDFANKIGTYGVAVLAKEHGIPLYVAAPFSSIDTSLSSGEQIPIEERAPEEVSCGFGKRTAPLDVKIYNPAFDVTPAKYVSGFITEKGILQPPFRSVALS